MSTSPLPNNYNEIPQPIKLSEPPKETDTKFIKDIYKLFTQIDTSPLYVKDNHFVWETLQGENKIKSVYLYLFI